MENENNDRRMESVYSKRVKAGKRRTYFFDVRETRGNDYFLTITESRKKFDSDGYDRHKIFLYKEDFNKFVRGLNEAVDYVKTELMPDFDFETFNHDNDEGAPNENGMANVLQSGKDVMPPLVEPALGDNPPVIYDAVAGVEIPEEKPTENSTDEDTSHKDIEGEKW